MTQRTENTKDDKPQAEPEDTTPRPQLTGSTSRRGGPPRTPQALDDLYRWLLWMVPIVNGFPRDHRFTLGDRMVNRGYDALELVLSAAQRREELLVDLPFLDVIFEAERLARELLRQTPLPPAAAPDALHIALAACHGMDYLLTWNCKHLGTASIWRTPS